MRENGVLNNLRKKSSALAEDFNVLIKFAEITLRFSFGYAFFICDILLTASAHITVMIISGII